VDFPLLIILISSYLLGSIPFGIVVTRLCGLGDIRQIGSGNIGATNVLRTGRKGLAALTLLLDGGKGAAAVLIAEKLYPGLGACAGLAALLGHIFPVWLKFKGGKGVATAIGVLTALAWPSGLAVMLTWLLMAFLFRYSSLAALVSLGLSTPYAYLFGHADIAWLTATISVLIFFTHRTNIQRLRNHTETKIGKKKNLTEPSVL